MAFRTFDDYSDVPFPTMWNGPMSEWSDGQLLAFVDGAFRWIRAAGPDGWTPVDNPPDANGMRAVTGPPVAMLCVTAELATAELRRRHATA